MGVISAIRAGISRYQAQAAYEAKQFQAAYEGVGAGTGGRQRRAAPIEFDGEESQLRGYQRHQAVARGRDLHRNFGQVQAWEWQFALNVIGTGPKIRFHTADERWNEVTARWFNRIWAATCDGKTAIGARRGRRHLSALTRLELCTVLREGDVLCFFDREGIMGGAGAEGQVHYFEADHIVGIQKFSAHRGAIEDQLQMPGPAQQSEGVITDQWGRPYGYIVTPEAGQIEVPYSKATILPHQNATLLHSPWRVNQLRGVAPMLTVAGDLEDIRDFRGSVLMRARQQANLGLIIKCKNAVRKAISRSDAGETATETAVTDTDAAAYTNYRNVEKWVRGAIAYVNPDDEITPMQLSGDSPEYTALSEDTINRSGYSLGLSRLHAGGKADASYSASMAEHNMGMLTWEHWRKWIERESLDWKAYKAIDWAIATGKRPAVDGWANFSWQGWPKSRGINPDREAKARATDLATGVTDYAQLLGPDWKKHFDSFSEQLDYARERNIPLALLASAMNEPQGD